LKLRPQALTTAWPDRRRAATNCP